jgi:AraC family transcriptional regulator
MQRFFSSIDFIEEKLFDDISVHDIAAASHYSTYYFSRFFKALVGDSPKEYLRRRRLSLAAQKLLTEDVSILDLALDCQFDSQAAFKQVFNYSPAHYRERGQSSPLLHRNKFCSEELNYLQEKLSMQPEIVTRPAMDVIGYLSHYSIDDLDLNRLWEPFFTHVDRIPNVIGRDGFDVYEPTIGAIDLSEFSYLAAIEVSSLNDIPEGLTGRHIPVQRYAVI